MANKIFNQSLMTDNNSLFNWSGLYFIRTAALQFPSNLCRVNSFFVAIMLT